MQERKVMDAIMQYLKEQKISDRQIWKDTKINISSERVLNASEFLRLCSYLRKRPEDFKRIAEEIKNDSVSL